MLALQDAIYGAREAEKKYDKKIFRKRFLVIKRTFKCSYDIGDVWK